jgi:predicted helicase
MKINEIFPINSVGVVTSRDEFVIAYDKNALVNNMLQFTNLSQPDEIIAQAFNLRDKPNWNIKEARKEISKISDLNTCIKEITYRPFDKRYIFYHPALIERMREDVMRHMLEENVGLITVRQVAEGVFNHCFITENIVESRITLSNKGIGYLFPLYLYRNKEKQDLFTQFQTEKEPNISLALLNKMESTYKHQFTPEDLLYYIYGIFFGKQYRETYAEFLKVDFPRVPFTSNYELFKKLAALGQRLVELHLLKSPEMEHPSVKYQGQGDDQVIIKPRYAADEKRIYINPTHYFEGVEPEVWHYQIGGYQVLDKYLKDRKGRRMDDSRHYIHIATALAKTIEIQQEIDALYPDVEKDLIEFEKS